MCFEVWRGGCWNEINVWEAKGVKEAPLWIGLNDVAAKALDTLKFREVWMVVWLYEYEDVFGFESHRHVMINLSVAEVLF